MSINIPTHYVQQYTSNVSMLLQQKVSKLRAAVMTGSYTGKQASIVDQVGPVEMLPVTSRFAPMGRVDAALDRRWVFPSDFELPQLIDNFDKLRLITDLQSSYVQNAHMAANRKIDRLICAAFTATAKTGEEGGTSTIFTAANEVDVATGGSNSKLNVAKLREVKRLMMANDIDFDMEEAYIGITAADHDALFGEIQVTSREFNGGAPVMQNGKIESFMGFKFIHCELIETVLAGTNEVTLPVWVKSGMHLGIWEDVKANVSIRNDLSSLPYQIYTTLTMGATRTEEDKVYAIESYRA